MRYLIDTNIFIFLAEDSGHLSKDVYAIIEDFSNLLYISAESVKELIVLVRNNKVRFKQWKTQVQMIEAIEHEFGIKILPIKKEHLLSYARLTINEAQDHRDPSDHIIISQAITEGIPLISSDHKFHFYTEQALDFVYNERQIRVMLTPQNLLPYPKNPCIDQIFTQMGRPEELGTGIRNVFKYSKAYSGSDKVSFSEVVIIN